MASEVGVGHATGVPPYPGCAHLYKDHPDYGGEVDHAELATLLLMFDGWCLHTSSVALPQILTLFEAHEGVRVMAWVKPFAAFKRNVSVAYAWEPVLVKPARKPVVKKGMGFTYRDWIAESITLKKGLTGAKPPKVCPACLEPYINAGAHAERCYGKPACEGCGFLYDPPTCAQCADAA